MPELFDNILRYEMGTGVEAFTAPKGVALPYYVTVGHQVHGIKVAEVDRLGMTREDLDGYDALVTNIKGCAIGVRTADCIPVLLYDPVHNAVGAAHAGWRGTVNRIVQKTLFKMNTLYGTDAADVVAVIGPGICKNSFQVGDEVVMAFKNNGFPLAVVYEWQGPKKAGMSGGHHIDLFEANRWLLNEAGVAEDNIKVSGICTYCDDRFFSARRDGVRCGRNINSIKLLSSAPSIHRR